MVVYDLDEPIVIRDSTVFFSESLRRSLFDRFRDLHRPVIIPEGQRGDQQSLVGVSLELTLNYWNQSNAAEMLRVVLDYGQVLDPSHRQLFFPQAVVTLEEVRENEWLLLVIMANSLEIRRRASRGTILASSVFTSTLNELCDSVFWFDEYSRKQFEPTAFGIESYNALAFIRKCFVELTREIWTYRNALNTLKTQIAIDIVFIRHHTPVWTTYYEGGDPKRMLAQSLDNFYRKTIYDLYPIIVKRETLLQRYREVSAATGPSSAISGRRLSKSRLLQQTFQQLRQIFYVDDEFFGNRLHRLFYPNATRADPFKVMDLSDVLLSVNMTARSSNSRPRKILESSKSMLRLIQSVSSYSQSELMPEIFDSRSHVLRARELEALRRDVTLLEKALFKLETRIAIDVQTLEARSLSWDLLDPSFDQDQILQEYLQFYSSIVSLELQSVIQSRRMLLTP